MNKPFTYIIFFTFFLCGHQLMAQGGSPAGYVKPVSVKDTSAGKTISPADSIKQKALQPVKSAVSPFNARLEAVNNSLQNSFKFVSGKTFLSNLTLGDAIQYQPTPTDALNPNQRFTNIVLVQGTVKPFGIPLNFNYNNARISYSGLSAYQNTLFKLDYNPTQLKTVLTSEVQQYSDVRNRVMKGLDLDAYTRQSLMDKLRYNTTPTGSVLNNSVIKQYISSTKNVNELLRLNDDQIRKKLMEQAEAQNSKALSAGITTQKETPGSATAATETYAKNTAQTNREIDTVVSTISKLKQRLAKEGTDVNKMHYIESSLTSGKGNPTELANSLATAKPANALQSLFTNFQSLKAGSFGNQVPGTFQSGEVLMSGTHLSFKTNNIPITLGYGSISDVTSVKDAGYQNSIYNTPRNITYIGTQVNDGFMSHIKFSVVSSVGNPSGNINYAVATPSSNNVAFTLTKAISMGQAGNLSVDVSKSTTVYADNYQAGSTVAVLNQKAGLVSSTYGTDLISALGFGLNHTLKVASENLTENVYFSYSGLGYQNPANNGYGGARTKLGGNVKKSFYKNKLSIGLRAEGTTMPISYTSNDQWRNYLVQLDSRYQVSKTFNFDLKYTTNGTERLSTGILLPVYTYQSLQAEGNLRYKIGKNYSVTHFSIGTQDLNNTYLSATSSQLLLFNYTQSLVINKNSLTATFFYNKELTSLKLIGDLFNGDMSYRYAIGKVSVSSGVTFLNNTGIASQAGVKQNVQLLASKSVDLSSYLDIRKNLITPVNDALYPASRVELMFRYHFIKQ